MKKLKITRIVTSSSTTPFNYDYYPDHIEDIQGAAEYERSQPVEEWAEYFFEEITINNIQSFVEIVEEDD